MTCSARPPSRSILSARFPSERSRLSLDLVNVVAGGDGFSGRRNAGIDPDQRPGDRYCRRRQDLLPLLATGGIIASPGLPFVDGVFVPDGRTGPVQLDSAGHVFDGFPATSQSDVGFVWAGGAIPTDSRMHRMTMPCSTASTTPRPVTACWRWLPTRASLSIWRPFAGPIPAASCCGSAPWRATPSRFRRRRAGVYADLWVLVDGQVRFRPAKINGLQRALFRSPFRGENDRFLTLAATDGGNGIEYDWTMFGDPRLNSCPARLPRVRKTWKKQPKRQRLATRNLIYKIENLMDKP